MSAFGLHPTFIDLRGYRAWRRSWNGIYRDLQARRERLLSEPARAEVDVMLGKTRTLLETAQERMRRIHTMHRQIADQLAEFPLTIEASSIDFHFNKIAIEFPFMPAWIVKAKGRTYYVTHVDFVCPGTTRETPEHASTKGAIRFRHGTLLLERDGSARIVVRDVAALRQAA